jgi:hypothetical protein
MNSTPLTLDLAAKTDNGLWLARIRGPKGVIEIRDLVWIVDRQDLLEVNYWESWLVLNGAYHCCLSIPGKVALLIEQDPGREMR